MFEAAVGRFAKTVSKESLIPVPSLDEAERCRLFHVRLSLMQSLSSSFLEVFLYVKQDLECVCTPSHVFAGVGS